MFFTCSGLFNPRGVYRISLSVKVRFSGKQCVTCMRGNTPTHLYARDILRRKITFEIQTLSNADFFAGIPSKGRQNALKSPVEMRR